MPAIRPFFAKNLVLVRPGVTTCCHRHAVRLLNMSNRSAGTAPRNLLIVDDHGLVREGLVALFRAEDQFEVTVAGVAAAIWVAPQFSPDLALINLTATDGRPSHAAPATAAPQPPSPIVFLDDTVNPDHLARMTALGVSGYWTKRASFQQLLDAIERVLDGGTSYCPIAEKHLAAASKGLRPRLADGACPPAKLSPRETEVLSLVVQGHTVKECARLLEISPSTVENIKSHLMRKLGAHRLADLVRIAVKNGWV